ncbi:MAG: flagellar assembly peptidoglycan hydrolase FlgJ [Steroidobacter sp.]
MTAPANNATFYADFKSLAALKHEATTDSQKALRGAAQQFESLFINMMLKSAREATSSVGDSISGGSEMDMYQSMFDEQIATQMSKGKGLGLADMLVQQLNRSGMVKGAPSANSGGADKTPSSGSASKMTLPPDKKITTAVPNQAAPVTKISKAPASVTTSSSTAQKPGPNFSSPAEFVEKMWPYAQQAAQKLGVDPRTLIAHAALETGWGKHIPCQGDGSSSFNLFGIKAGSGWNGQSIGSATLEFDQGVAVKRVERFKAYDSPEQCFADYASLLSSHPRYGETLNAGANTAKFAHALQKGGYATDPDYAHKLKAVARNVMSLVNSITGNASAQFAGTAQAPSSHADI